MLDNFTLQILEHNHSNKETEHFDCNQFYSLSKLVPPPPVSDNDNEQSVSTINYRGSMASTESSDMVGSIWPSSFTSNSNDQSIVSQNEALPNPKQEESGEDLYILQDIELIDIIDKTMVLFYFPFIVFIGYSFYIYFPFGQW